MSEPPTLRCCICDDPVAPPYNVIGRRVYCDRHYATINKANPGVWRASLIQIVSMGIFSAIVEPDRSDALLGAIVMEELDFLVDCISNTVQPRDPNTTISEVE